MSTPPLNDHDLARFMRKFTVSDDGCWRWTGTITKAQASGKSGGYGEFSYGGKGGRNRFAHRISYEQFNGPVPDGFQVDHVCHTEAVRRGECSGGHECLHRRCVNPAHLEAVTPRENTMRGDTRAAENARKTHCPQGHPFDLANTAISPSGARICRACKRVKSLAWWHRQKRAVA